MSDEKKVNTETTAVQAPDSAPKKKHWPIVLSVLAVVVIAVLVAFLHWHEEPSFCSTFCHQPMDYYVDGYYSEDPALSSANHAEAGVTCLGCHWSQAKLLDLVHEVVMFATDSFTNPLPDQKQFVNDEFCGACHDGETAPTKESVTEGWTYDPHNIPTDVSMHEGQDFTCGSCHSVHKQSTLTCASCHTDFMDGLDEETKTELSYWDIPTNEAQAATATMFVVDNGDGTTTNYDPHGDYEALSSMHATAGSDGGAITCSDCHDTNTIVCAECHNDVFTEENLPEGWSLAPESEAKAATAEAYGVYDPHAGDAYVQFSTMHETAGSDGGTITCADCHDTNTIKCAQCHLNTFEGNVPEGGWTLSVNEAKAATAEAYGVFDPHAGDAYVQFSPMHETAGADGGTITCADCHDTQVIKCAQCHLNTFEGNVPEGWSLPEGAMDVTALAASTEDTATDEAAAEDEAAADETADEAAAPASDATYTDGTYEAAGKGIGGDVPVTVTVEGGVITDVTVGDNAETQGIGTNAIEQLPSAIVAANGTAGVDGVSGATITSNAIFDAVNDCLTQAGA